MKVKIVKKILADNDEIASENRKLMAEKGILCVNLMSGPGSGKTTLLEKTIPLLGEKHGLGTAVIEGDVEGDLDGARLDNLGAPVVQLNTTGACHLDASMIRSALEEFPADGIDILFVENVGNLVCPAGFDLGEDLRAVLLSVPEGDDKPIKYPAMFRKARALLINKIDLAPYLEFSTDRVREACRRINPDLLLMEISARTGEGLESWIGFLRENLEAKRGK